MKFALETTCTRVKDDSKKFAMLQVVLRTTLDTTNLSLRKVKTNAVMSVGSGSTTRMLLVTPHGPLVCATDLVITGAVRRCPCMVCTIASVLW